MNITGESLVGQIASEFPLATRVFARHQLDFCCGGGKPLEVVCEQKGLDCDVIIQEIEKELSQDDSGVTHWDQAPLNDLIEHILATYHAPLREELPRLVMMAERVNQVHGDKAPEAFPELVEVILALQTELTEHMAKEEQILFPMIQQGKGAMAQGPVAVMHEEHESAGNALQRFRELTNDYTVPEKACNTWRALWHGLGALEEAMHQHIHLENNILFPRALAGQ